MAASRKPPPPPAPETYWELEAELERAAEEPWSWFCFQRGATGAEWREDSPARLRVAYFFDQVEEPAPARWREAFRAAFPQAPLPGRITLAERPRQPWASAWHAHFAPAPVGRSLLVCPPWDRPAPGEAPPGRRPLVIEPGQGFGTGRHATTVLALELLEAHLAGAPGQMPASLPARILDVGTGSGVLAIAARLLGVPRAVALDIDGRVMAEVARNFRHNGLEPPLRIRGGPECLRGKFPLVVANLVMPLLALVAAHLAALTEPGGSLIVSGVLEEERAALLPPYELQGLRLREERTREGWLACRFERLTSPPNPLFMGRGEDFPG